MALGVAGAGGYVLSQMKSELSPTSKTAAPSSITGNAPEGASLAYTQRYAGQVEQILAGVPELSSYLVIVGAGEVTRFLTFARLKDWDEREVKQQQITQSLLPKLRKIAGVQASASNPASLGVARLRQAVAVRHPVFRFL